MLKIQYRNEAKIFLRIFRILFTIIHINIYLEKGLCEKKCQRAHISCAVSIHNQSCFCRSRMVVHTLSVMSPRSRSGSSLARISSLDSLGKYICLPYSARTAPACRLKVVPNGRARCAAIRAFGSISMGAVRILDSSPAPLSKMGQ